MKFAFFGTDNFSVTFLEALKSLGVLPDFVITQPDRPKGRKLILTPSNVKVWATENLIPSLEPEKFDSEFIEKLKTGNFDFFLVASYGKILPKDIIDLPKYKSLNIHPSLLPKLRGPSPLQETILRNEAPGVTIMKMDEKMDEGPIIAQKKVELKNWPIKASELNELLAVEGAELFSETIQNYLNGKIKEIPQDSTHATYTKMIEKNDGLINLSDDAELNYRKILAYNVWPRAFFKARYQNKDIKVIITEAKLELGKLVIEKVIPEGKKEMRYSDFQKSLT